MTMTSPPSGYHVHDLERWAPEPAKRSGRSEFARDRARVLHSAALRRLAGKTQVLVPLESDFPRTRLTHSLECAQIGRELGGALGADGDLVEVACLAHDLGHPPFGHNGELALDEVAAPAGGFEGNAQSLRILTRLEAKAFDERGHGVGLNLTRAALDAATKYPWPAAHGTSGKYGVYTQDLPVFGWVRGDVPPGRRCVEAQVMDWADDVAYSVHDLEDALHAGHLRVETLRDPAERAELFRLTAARYADADEAEVEAALDRLLAQPSWPDHYDGSLRAQAALKNATSQLIGRFCLAAEHATRHAYGDKPLTRHSAELVVPRVVALECAVLKAVTWRYVIDSDATAGRRAHQREVVRELGEALARRAPDSLEPGFAAAFRAAADDADRLRAVVDQIASLTDAAALHAHARLVGGSRR
jgi:dGTPase